MVLEAKRQHQWLGYTGITDNKVQIKRLGQPLTPPFPVETFGKMIQGMVQVWQQTSCAQSAAWHRPPSSAVKPSQGQGNNSRTKTKHIVRERKFALTADLPRLVSQISQTH